MGGALDVIYDPKDTGNVVIPDEVPNGRRRLVFAVSSGVVLFLCLAIMLIDFAG